MKMTIDSSNTTLLKSGEQIRLTYTTDSKFLVINNATFSLDLHLEDVNIRFYPSIDIAGETMMFISGYKLIEYNYERIEFWVK